MYTFDENIISDLHKDARGFRPTEAFWNAWNSQDDEGKQTVWDILIDEMEYNQKEEERIEAENLAKFREQVAATMKFCDCNWKKAVEFLADAEDDDVHCEQGFDYFLWKQGIGFKDRANIRSLYKK